MKLITKGIKNKLKNFPLRSQDGKGMDAKVIARFFVGCATWYILEGSEDELYGLVDLGYAFEYGYFTASELSSIRVKPFGLPVERDRFVPPAKYTLGECFDRYGEKLM